MAEPAFDSNTDIPDAVAVPRSPRSLQLVWLIPLVAALIGGWFVVKSVLDRGPVITISFKTAEGLEAGKTKIKYKDVDVGLVTAVTLAPDLTHVIVTAELGKGAAPHLVDDTHFWVARARVSAGSITGLGTLLGGAHIGVDIGKSTTKRSSFVGLEAPPVFTTDLPGREFALRAETIGSLSVGSPVFFRRLQVGQVAAYRLNEDGHGVTLRIFINAPYDQYVNAGTRFWEESGIDVKLDASGVQINTHSLMSMAIGGIAFQTPASAEALPPAEPAAVFDLYGTQTAAMKRPDAIVDTYVLVFNESLRGLSPGAPVDFRGVVVGEVVSISTQIDPVTAAITLPVEIHFYPERFAARSADGPKTGRMLANPMQATDMMVARGLRAQVRTGNLLTGQLYIALDFFPQAPKVKVDWAKRPTELPTVMGSVEDLRMALNGIFKKFDKIDFGGIGTDLQQTLKSTTQLMKRLDTELAPEARAMLEEARHAIAAAERTVASNSPLERDARDALREISRAAQSFRSLADYLDQHPEALIRGRKGDAP